MSTQPQTDESVLLKSAMQPLTQRLDRVDGKMEALTVQVTNVGASIMPRAEITAADDRRVSVEAFVAQNSSNEMRLARLENGPQRSIAWISLIISGVFGFIGCLGTGVAILGTIFGVIWAIAASH